MSAVRLARGFSNREKIIKFLGCYHGHSDSFLIQAGSGAVTFGSPNSPGVTQGTAKDTLLAPYNNLEAVRNINIPIYFPKKEQNDESSTLNKEIQKFGVYRHQLSSILINLGFLVT